MHYIRYQRRIATTTDKTTEQGNIDNNWRDKFESIKVDFSKHTNTHAHTHAP